MRRPTLLLLLLAVLAGCAPAALPSAGQPPSATPVASAVVDGPVDIGGGRQLYLHCAGPQTAGRPTIVLESGYHDSSDPWNLTDAAAPAVGPSVFERLSAGNRVCAYDRPGTFRYADPLALTDRSTPVPMPRTARAVVDDLHALLGAAAVPGPYLLVGHSMGGLFARLYAQLHPADVVGVVFVDAFPVEFPELMGAVWPEHAAVLADPVPQFANDPAAAEVVDVEASAAEVRAAPAYPAVPTVVLSKTEPFPLPAGAPPTLGPALDRAWPEGQQKLVALTPRTPHVVDTGSDHYVQVHDPDLVSATAELLLTRAGH
ncbi:alpha/beta fold hydrolase [Pseudonocardia pini]|uniref:alpha/beta fold hydrolase n=1 Tax=Pseudonocardia pini TaxID=2758030 RepID=UPI0015F0DB98|nr:alpha/beta hydrolase [Pseudonocardia pini]